MGEYPVGRKDWLEGETPVAPAGGSGGEGDGLLVAPVPDKPRLLPLPLRGRTGPGASSCAVSADMFLGEMPWAGSAWACACAWAWA